MAQESFDLEQLKTKWLIIQYLLRLVLRLLHDEIQVHSVEVERGTTATATHGESSVRYVPTNDFTVTIGFYELRKRTITS